MRKANAGPEGKAHETPYGGNALIGLEPKVLQKLMRFALARHGRWYGRGLFLVVAGSFGSGQI